MSSGSILFALVSGFFIGIAAGSLYGIGYVVVFFVLVCAVVVSVLGPQGSSRVVVSLVCVGIALGMLRMDCVPSARDAAIEPLVGNRINIRGTIIAEPDIRDAQVRLVVRNAEISRATHDAQSFLVVAPAHTDTSYGDEVTVTGTVRPPEAFDTGSGRSFNYPKYLAKDGIYYEIDRAQATKTGNWNGNYVIAAALAIKHWYTHGLQTVLPEPYAGLAAGITVGDKRSVGASVSEDFQKVSLTHVLVLSGYNITIVASMLLFLLKGTHRWLRYGAAGLVVVFFVLITGAAASALRAGLMAGIALFAEITHRSYDATRALIAAVFLMMLWKPLSLLYDPGLQLSVLATLGLIYLAPLVTKRVTWITERFGTREIVATTIAAQCAVMPLLFMQNGLPSLFALPANILVLAVVPLAMATSAIAGIVGAVAGHVSFFVAAPAYVLLVYIVSITHFFASLP